MPFISSITRRKENAGITLKAKLISPNRPNLTPRKSRILKYKIRIKAKTLSDYECCVIDNSYLSSRISDTNSLAGLKTSLNNLQSTAAYDTYTTYSIIPLEDNGNIRSFLKDDGTLEGRPKLGESNSDGYIVIKTSKNSESVTTKLPVTIESYSAQEIINDSSLYEIGNIWDKIKGNNDYSALNGYNNIMYDIDFTGLSSANLFSEKVVTNSNNIDIFYDIDIIESNNDKLTNNLNQKVSAIELTNNRETGMVSRPSYAMCVSNFKSLYVNAGQIKSEYDTTENKILEPVNGSNSTDGIMPGSIRYKIMGSTQFNRICFRKKGIKIKITPRIRMNNVDYTPTNGGPIINCGVLSEFFDMAGSEDCQNFINDLVDKYTIRWYRDINDATSAQDYNFDNGTVIMDDGSTPAASGSMSTLEISSTSGINYGILEIAQTPFLDPAIINAEGALFQDYIIGYGDNQYKSRVGGVNLNSITTEAFIRKKDNLSSKLDAGTVDNIFFEAQIDGLDNAFYDASLAGSLPSVTRTVPGWQPEQRGVQRIKIKYNGITSTAPIEFAVLFKFTIRGTSFVKSTDNPLSTFTNNVEQTIYKAKAFKLTLSS